SHQIRPEPPPNAGSVVVTCRRMSVRCCLWQAEQNPSRDRLQLLDLRALAGWLSWPPHQAGSPGVERVAEGNAPPAAADLPDWSPDSTHAQMRGHGDTARVIVESRPLHLTSPVGPR